VVVVVVVVIRYLLARLLSIEVLGGGFRQMKARLLMSLSTFRTSGALAFCPTHVLPACWGPSPPTAQLVPAAMARRRDRQIVLCAPWPCRFRRLRLESPPNNDHPCTQVVNITMQPALLSQCLARID